jgi:hypothetical protein
MVGKAQPIGSEEISQCVSSILTEIGFGCL